MSIKTFKIIVECEIQFKVGKVSQNRVVREDSDFGDICEGIAIECLEKKASEINLRSIEELTEGQEIEKT